MTLIEDIVRRLEAQGMTLWASSGQIRFRGPRHAANASDLEALSQRREETLAFLAARPDRAPVTVSQRPWLRPDQHLVPMEYQRTPVAFDLEGPMDIALFARAIDLAREHQDILRTRYGQDEDGALFQTTEGVAEAEAMRVIDLGAQSESDQRKAVWLTLKAAYAQPPRLAEGQPLTAWMFKLSDTTHVFAAIVDHIALDNRSMEIIMTTIFRLYDSLIAGGDAALPPLKHRYADYARSVQTRHDLARLGANLAWWRAKIGDLQCADLRDPLRRIEGPGRRASSPLRFPEQTRVGALALAKDQGVTLSVLMTAVFGLLTARWADAERIMCGYVVDERPLKMADTAGCFIRTSPLILDVSGDPTAVELIARTRASLVDTIDPDRTIWSRDIPRLANLLINLQTPSQRTVRDITPGGLTIKARKFRIPLMQDMSLDFQIFLKQHPRSLFGHVLFAADRVNPKSVKWFTTGAPIVLDRIVQRPDERISRIAPPRQPAQAKP